MYCISLAIDFFTGCTGLFRGSYGDWKELLVAVYKAVYVIGAYVLS